MDLAGLFGDYTLRVVALGSAILGAASGALGSLAVLRKQSLLGDAISHAALPGIVLAFLLTGSKATLVLVLGAAVAGWLGTLAVIAIVRNTRVKEDSGLGIVLSVFFGLGLVLLTYVQTLPDASQAGLDRFLFGQAATMLMQDVTVIAALGSVAVVLMLLGWKEIKLLAFDRTFGASMGINMGRVDVLLTSIIVLAIVIGLQTVGVVLMSAMVVAPGAAARQWTDRMERMVAIAAFFGAVAGLSGAVLSSTVQRLPTGPTIVLCLSAIVLVSLLFAPNRGIVWNLVRTHKQRRQLRADAVLADLYSLAGQHLDTSHGHSIGALEAMRMGQGSARRSLSALRERGWARETRPGEWTLTPSGMEEARRRFDAGASPDEHEAQEKR
ncbi:MAG TPA: metal ABC transporter permease [Longimicrobiaceae bacterium]